ncbi:MAG: Hsp70 family protein, partial [Chloroflexaceae bacterium]|nr:Hsp70 family protein [Chloroflexaceae bacterium]
TITASSGLSEAEIEQMIRDAEAHAEEDRRRRELIEARNHADSLIYTAERSMREVGDALDGAIRTEVQDKISALRAVLDSDDVNEIRNKSAELSVSMQKIGQAAYEAQRESANGADASGGKAGDDVVEGEYKVD